MAQLSSSTQTIVAKPNVLITGFGPFPGVVHNVSGELAEVLADAAGTRFPGYAFHAEVLATEWQRAPQRIAGLYRELAPVLSLHFGVSEKAQSIVIERMGHNACLMAADALGALPCDDTLIAGGAAVAHARLPLSAIYRRLTAVGVPVQFSDDAGRYLCNAVLYHALAHACAQRQPARAGFIHLPCNLERPPLSFSGTLRAALEIVDVALTEAV